MARPRNKPASQRTRLVLLGLYLIGLFAVSRAALGHWWPPTTEKGLWFYAGLVALLLGNLLITPFFTKPVDALSYAVPAVIALLTANAWSIPNTTGFDCFLWTAVMAYLVAIVAAGIGSIAMKDTVSETGQKISRSFYHFSDVLGGPRAVCSSVFIFALVTFHRENAREYLWIGAAWLLFIGLRPLETLVELWTRWRTVWAASAVGKRLGQIVGHQLPRLALVEEDRVDPAPFGALLATRLGDGRTGFAMAVDHVGFADGRWLRAIELVAPVSKVFRESHQPLLDAMASGAVFQVGADSNGSEPQDKVWQQRQILVGLITEESNVAEVRIDVARTDQVLRQGALVEVRIGEREVSYQLIDGLTREEIVQQKNTRGFVQAEAKKIGVWNYGKKRFEHVPWLPQPNEPVFLVKASQAPASKEAVGYFPSTDYPISVDEHALVTHNTAILGILGVGKSFLALELVERMLSAGVKTICLDLTNQYATELAPHYDSTAEAADIAALEAIGPAGKTNVKKNVEEGGSVGTFSIKVKEQIKAFLDPACLRKLKILNPARFEVWRQDSKPYANEASMATLTPTEITRIITEAALEALQAQGMTDQARCCLVYEEAHSLIPEWNAVASDGDKTATNGTAKAILQGRKFGLGCLVITQRTANVTKTILNQCNTVFALRVFDATGMEFLKNYVGEDYAGVLCNLEDRHAVIFGRGSSCDDPVLIRLNDRDKFLRVFRPPPPPIAPPEAASGGAG